MILKYLNKGNPASRIILLILIYSYIIINELIFFYLILLPIIYFISLILSKKIVFHCHTHHSHDSELKVNDYNALNKSLVFITNHEEDMSEKSIISLRKEISKEQEKKIKFFQGIELNFLKQHVLLFDIKYYSHKGFKIFSKGIYCWAHPVLPLKDFRSIITFLRIILFTNAVEIFNIKSAKRGYYFWSQNFILGSIGVIFFFNFPLIGHDIHEI